MRAFISAIKFLTVFPIDTRGRIPPGHVGWSLLCFPIVGILLGGVCAGVFWGAAKLFPLDIAAALAILTLVLCTGALHMDGLADTADGIFGGHTKERMLEIMRDTRIGAFGIIAIVLLLMLKVLAANGIAATSKTNTLAALVMMPMTGRWMILLATGLCRYAREGEGTGRAFVENGRPWHFIAWIPVVAGSAWALLGLGGLAMLAMVLPFLFLLIVYIRSRIGGMTGDTLGAVCEVSEVVFLLSFFVSAKLGLFVWVV